MAELLTVPLTTTAKARILRVALRCDSGVKLQSLDRLYEADKLVPPDHPRPILLLEHCTGLATMMRTYQLTAAHLLEQRHLIAHWGARLSMCLHYVSSSTAGRPDKPLTYTYIYTYIHIWPQPRRCTRPGGGGGGGGRARSLLRRLKRSARQCARSATIWAPGRSRNPYFVVLWASLLFGSRF